MNSDLFQDIISFGITALIAIFVWRHYKGKTYPSEQRYSTFVPRFCTGFVDSSVLAPVTLLSNGLLILGLPKILAAIIVLIESVAWLLYTVVLHVRFGQTVGKMVTHVKVVDFKTEGKISWRQAWLREGIPAVVSFGCVAYEIYVILLGHVPQSEIANGKALTQGPFIIMTSLPGLWFLAEIVTMLTNSKRRALHDLIAGTVVIRTNTDPVTTQEIPSPAGPVICNG